jgi:hypothetical protein
MISEVIGASIEENQWNSGITYQSKGNLKNEDVGEMSWEYQVGLYWKVSGGKAAIWRRLSCEFSGLWACFVNYSLLKIGLALSTAGRVRL